MDHCRQKSRSLASTSGNVKSLVIDTAADKFNDNATVSYNAGRNPDRTEGDEASGCESYSKSTLGSQHRHRQYRKGFTCESGACEPEFPSLSKCQVGSTSHLESKFAAL